MLTIVRFPNYTITTNGNVYNKYGKMLKTRLNNSGYPVVYLRKNGKTYTKLVHRLVALTYIPNPENKPCIDHIDSDRTNCDVSNLRWCTYSENNIYARAKRVYCVETDTIYDSVKDAAKALNTFGAAISAVLKGKRHTANKFHFKEVFI